MLSLNRFSRNSIMLEGMIEFREILAQDTFTEFHENPLNALAADTRLQRDRRAVGQQDVVSTQCILSNCL
jgi:hypothetical protein